MLTVKQKMTLEAIEWFIKMNGYSPTCREIAKLLNRDIRSIFNNLMILEEKGYIRTSSGKARSIKVLKGVEE